MFILHTPLTGKQFTAGRLSMAARLQPWIKLRRDGELILNAKDTGAAYTELQIALPEAQLPSKEAIFHTMRSLGYHIPITLSRRMAAMLYQSQLQQSVQQSAQQELCHQASPQLEGGRKKHFTNAVHLADKTQASSLSTMRQTITIKTSVKTLSLKAKGRMQN
ncbi:hypothetical protein PT974_01200 [Cladobotryum mycophilum]|uniref:Uncharacterized protein n=1 Tax=Cladobotryum mycophilum TaxID=491253 RepID=A0ABR0T325_9HYPO